MRTLLLLLLAAAVACNDSAAPQDPPRPLAPWDYVLHEFNGEDVPTATVESGHLILHEDSTFFDVTRTTDGVYEGFSGRFSLNARADSIYFTPSVRSGIQPYAAAITRDSVRVIIPELGLSRLFREN